MPGPDDARRRIPTLDAVLSAPQVTAHLAAFDPAAAKALVSSAFVASCTATSTRAVMVIRSSTTAVSSCW